MNPKISLILLCILSAAFPPGSAAQTFECAKKLENFYLRPATALSSAEKKDLIVCAFELQNAGFALDESACQYDSARVHIERALNAWTYLDDTLQQANLLKYLGYLNAQLGKYDVAKRQINEAIRLYLLKNTDSGVAISRFNMARVYEYQNHPDSVAWHVHKALMYWKKENEWSRIFILHNYLIHLGTAFHKDRNVEAYISDNLTHINQPELYWQNELDFYYLTAMYYKHQKLKEKKEHYKTLYDEKVEALFRENKEYRYALYDPRNCK